MKLLEIKNNIHQYIYLYYKLSFKKFIFSTAFIIIKITQKLERNKLKNPFYSLANLIKNIITKKITNKYFIISQIFLYLYTYMYK